MSMPAAPARSLSTPLMLAALAALVFASFASLPLQWAAFFTPEAATSSAEFFAGFAPPETDLKFLRNLNTPEEYEAARKEAGPN